MHCRSLQFGIYGELLAFLQWLIFCRFLHCLDSMHNLTGIDSTIVKASKFSC